MGCRWNAWSQDLFSMKKPGNLATPKKLCWLRSMRVLALRQLLQRLIGLRRQLSANGYQGFKGKDQVLRMCFLWNALDIWLQKARYYTFEISIALIFSERI